MSEPDRCTTNACLRGAGKLMVRGGGAAAQICLPWPYRLLTVSPSCLDGHFCYSLRGYGFRLRAKLCSLRTVLKESIVNRDVAGLGLFAELIVV